MNSDLNFEKNYGKLVEMSEGWKSTGTISFYVKKFIVQQCRGGGSSNLKLFLKGEGGRVVNIGSGIDIDSIADSDT